jgi:hypothetical protein
MSDFLFTESVKARRREAEDALAKVEGAYLRLLNKESGYADELRCLMLWHKRVLAVWDEAWQAREGV